MRNVKKIKVAIIGYGNLGKAVENAIEKILDIQLVGIFTRRELSGTNFYCMDDLHNFKNRIDVCILCGSSKKDIPIQAPQILRNFNCVDCFDVHAEIPNYLKKMNTIGKANNNLAIISGGWDPGLFSLVRLMFDAILPFGVQNTFWGEGVSQGHSEAVRRLNGVKHAVQYTIPNQNAVSHALAGESLAVRDKHFRKVFVVTEENANNKQIEQQIVTMPNYFEGYNTEVLFIIEKEFQEKHLKMPHGGMVIQTGHTSENNKAAIKLELKADNNPEFTASVLVALARACFKMSRRGVNGAKTIYDIKPIDLTSKSRTEVIKKML